MIEDPLYTEYKKLCKDIRKIYVIPKINFSSPGTDYLYLLYKDFLENKNDFLLEIRSLSIFRHYEIILSRIKNENSILHYHWLEITDLKSLAGMVWKISAVSLFKLLGGKIIWTVHNKFPHRRCCLFLNKIIRIYFAFLADKIHVHCSGAADIMGPILKVKPDKFFTVKHPEFPAVIIPRDRSIDLLKEKYKTALELKKKKNFLMFGAIARYKGIIEAAALFKDLRNNNLIIAGPVKRWDKGYLKEVLIAVRNASNICLIPKFIPDVDIPVFFNCADFLLFNFSEILTSGSVILGLNYGKKVIAPAAGCIREIDEENIIKFEPGNIRELKAVLHSL
ncbi:MAG TPA: hypothetical protein VMT35_19310 [Ignavibacteriaceae bacterium]|nr:hypothetical protein [Ignavibacteriaceae bacterium]